MQKQLRIITHHRIAVCPLSISVFPLPKMPSVLFSRHTRRLPQVRHANSKIKVHVLPNYWFVWFYPSGARQLNALPF